MSCSTVVPGRACACSRVSRSPALVAVAARAISLAVSWNRSVLATKSVSQFSSTSTPAEVPSRSAVTRPLAAVRVARLFTSLAPLRRSSSTAASRSPSASASAFLQSIMPAPVCSRSRLTSAAVKFAISSSLAMFGLVGRVRDARLVVGFVARGGIVAGDRGFGIDLGVGGSFDRGRVHLLRVERDLRVSRVFGCLLGSCHLVGGLEGGGGGSRVPGAHKQLALPFGQRLLGARHATGGLVVTCGGARSCYQAFRYGVG